MIAQIGVKIVEKSYPDQKPGFEYHDNGNHLILLIKRRAKDIKESRKIINKRLKIKL